jgi:hypothetical protein
MGKLLSERSVGIIYAIKVRHCNSYREEVANFMSKYTNTPVEYYHRWMLDRIIVNTFSELLDYVEHPSSVFRDYYTWAYQSPLNYDNFDAMCAALSNVQVKEKDAATGEYEYINGFWDFNINNFMEDK